MHQDEDQLSESFFEATIAVHAKILSHVGRRQLLHELDQEYGQKGPFSSVYKLEAISKKAATPPAITWAITAAVDLFRRGDLKLEDFSQRSIEGKSVGMNGKGLADVLVEQKK